ncbi:MAG: extracellular solute-binding protein [Planctomycetota bacterium]|nr:extracellular solute-binding protein [Planctomycetota bacterium]MDA1106082.1 extracellular solute-binding protein [Planctomycetota bacterium]
MKHSRIWLALVPVAVLVAIPILLARSGSRSGDEERFIVIVTPHNEEIRQEFEHAFKAWHADRFGERVGIRWDLPGGTSEIKRLLLDLHGRALEDGRPTINIDIFFGGGSYEYTNLAKPYKPLHGGADGEPVLASAPLPEGVLSAAFPEQTVGGRELYDADRRWFATALSTFGIAYNPEACQKLGTPAPESWEDLADPRLQGWVAMTNPGQSGSVLTAFETILLRRGWVEGWQILSRAGANARTFSGSSADIPKRISAGACAAGVCIDFYARREAQVVGMGTGTGGERIAFVAPRGASVIDPDPVAMLTGAREPELAVRFIEFCLSMQGQALWQFKVGARVDELEGPQWEELRRLPARREMYERYRSEFRDADQPSPFLDATAPPNKPAYRPLISPMFSAIVIQPRTLQQAAWRAILNHPAYPTPRPGEHAPIVTANDVSDPVLKDWLGRFDALPTVLGPGGREYSLANEEDLEAVSQGWLRGAWRDLGLWPSDMDPETALLRDIAIGAIRRYELILEQAERMGIPTN